MAIIHPGIMVILHEITGRVLIKLNITGEAAHSLPIPSCEGKVFRLVVVVQNITRMNQKLWFEFLHCFHDFESSFTRSILVIVFMTCGDHEINRKGIIFFCCCAEASLHLVGGLFIGFSHNPYIICSKWHQSIYCKLAGIICFLVYSLPGCFIPMARTFYAIVDADETFFAWYGTIQLFYRGASRHVYLHLSVGPVFFEC